MIKTYTLSLLAIAAIAIAACNSPASASPGTASRTGNPPTAPASTDHSVVNITVDGNGFTPSTVQAEKGKKLTLRFTRKSDGTCAKQAAFPELGFWRDLPLDQAVDVEIPAAEARTLTFQCGMGMYQSSVVVR